MVLTPNGCNLLSGALSTAIELVVYGDEEEGKDGAKAYELRRLPGSTLLLVALGWNRLVQAEVALHNLTAVHARHSPNVFASFDCKGAAHDPRWAGKVRGQCCQRAGWPAAKLGTLCMVKLTFLSEKTAKKCSFLWGTFPRAVVWAVQRPLRSLH